jgi:AAA15 family ATPase/GTPase
MKISLIEFSVQNFKAFKDKVTLSMSGRKNDGHTFESNEENLLKTSFIYGPNASGKTSLLEAFVKLKTAILFSANNTENSNLPYTPFYGSLKSRNEPTFFEITFSIDDGEYCGLYQYNFSFVADKILTENMVKVPLGTGDEELIISRFEQNITIGKLLDNAHVIAGNNTRNVSLFLSQAAQFNSKFAMAILEVMKKINIISGIDNSGLYSNYTINKFKEDIDFKNKILKYLEKADFSISGGSVEEFETSLVNIKDIPGEFSATKTVQKANKLFLEHSVYNKDNKKVDVFKLPLDLESNGTQKFIAMIGPMIDTLNEGKVLLIDEFDNSLHPLITKFIIDLFESEYKNTNNAQLIVTTHDTNLLSYKDEFIKDQFWFTQKDEQGASTLFSLGEYDIRNDTEFAKKYLEGRFGGLPFISSSL